MSDSGEEKKSDRELRAVDDCRPSIKQWCKDVARGGNTKKTKRKYKRDLRWFDEYLDEIGLEDPRDLSVRQASNLGFDLAERSNGATGWDRWTRIYNYYDELLTYDEIDSNPLERWQDKRRSRFGLSRESRKSEELEKQGKKAALNIGEVRDLERRVNYPDERNQLVIRWLWQTGMRRGEMAGLRWDGDWEYDEEDDPDWIGEECDVDVENRRIRVRAANSKTNTKRILCWQPNCDDLVEHWLKIGREDALKKEKGDPGKFFVGINGDRLSGDAINNLVKRAADRADIQSFLYTDENGGTRDRITAHALRHGLGHYLVHNAGPDENGIDIYKVSKILGHSSVDITEKIYVGHETEAGLEELEKWGPE
jgi:integrase/recombinase XerD